MSYILENKESKNVFKYLKQAFECFGYPEELRSDRKEFKNKLIEDYLNENDINYIQGNSYNPNSQGMVEHFHQTTKDMLYCFYLENKYYS